ncbi:MAG: hypothetical protein U0793_25105 [Gemmataceae bacterium]
MLITNGSTVTAHDFMTVNGAVNVLPGSALVVDATLYMVYTSTATGLIVASAVDLYGPISEDPDAAHVSAAAVVANSGSVIEVQDETSLSVEADMTDYGGDLLLDSGTSVLEIDGAFSQDSESPGSITAAAGAALSFYGNGSDDDVVIHGTFDFGGDDGGATLSSENLILIDGGTFTSTGSSGNTIDADVGVVNDGTLEVSNSLTIATGSLTIGARTAEDTTSDATLELDASSSLSFPSADDPSTFVITSDGALNMHGASISMDTDRVSALDLEGTFNSYGYSYGGSDSITGNLTMNGSLSFTGSSLHMVWVSGDYTQGSSAELSMRLVNTPTSDVLGVGGTATIDGTLTLSGSSLSANYWNIIQTFSGVSGAFDTINDADGGSWSHGIVGNNFRVTKS